MPLRSGASPGRRAAASLFVATFLVRAGFALVNHGYVTGDVEQILGWGRLILGHALKYPSNYPPLWYYVSALLVVVSERTGVTYDLLLKLFPALSDAAIASILYVAVSRRRGRTGAGLLAAVLWMLNPVSVLVTSFHGQIDSVCLLLCLSAVLLLEGKDAVASPARADRFLVLSALLVGAAIGIKAWPVLFLPVFALWLPVRWSRRLLFCAVASFPTAVTLLPYLLAMPGPVLTAVLGYSGVTDHGLVAAARDAWFLRTGDEWLPGESGAVALRVGKLLFVPLYFVLLAFLRQRGRDMGTAILGVVLLFFAVYGGLSSQYLVWPLPFALLLSSPMSAPYTLLSAASLVFYYLRYFKEILVGGHEVAIPPVETSALAHLVSTTAWWVLVATWLVSILLACRRAVRQEAGTGLLPEARPVGGPAGRADGPRGLPPS